MAHEVRVKIDTAVVAHKDLEILVKNEALLAFCTAQTATRCPLSGF